MFPADAAAERRSNRLQKRQRHCCRSRELAQFDTSRKDPLQKKKQLLHMFLASKSYFGGVRGSSSVHRSEHRKDDRRAITFLAAEYRRCGNPFLKSKTNIRSAICFSASFFSTHNYNNQHTSVELKRFQTQPRILILELSVIQLSLTAAIRSSRCHSELQRVGVD